jgi:hypothetical protein
MNLADSQAMSFIFAPDEHLDIRLFDFYDRVPTSLIRDPIGRAAARRALHWWGDIPADASSLFTLQRPEFLKCLEALGATALLPTLVGHGVGTTMSEFSLVVSPFAREASFAAMRARLVRADEVQFHQGMINAIRLPKIIVQLGASTIAACLRNQPQDFVDRMKAKLQGTGFDSHHLDESTARKVVRWCTEYHQSEFSHVR